MKHSLFARFRLLIGTLMLTAPLSCSGATAWQEAQIADALRAAPPSITHTARIYAWQPYGHLVLVRDGEGPYTCVASGSASLRFAKLPLPSPDPFCADQHAWAFIQAFWTEPDPDPIEPVQILPDTPGMVWMLAGVNIVKAPVASGSDAPAVVPTQRAGAAEANITMTPQLMILPLPLDPAAAQLPGSYDPAHPLTLWMLARGTPIGLAPVQMTQVAQQALTAILPDPAQ
jgi:hypothetical protein